MRHLLMVLMVVTSGLVGCAEPAAVVQLLDASREAMEAVRQADEQVERALLVQAEQHRKKLDEAFISDMKRLADKKGRVAIEDVVAGKAYYDGKLAALEESRRNIVETFRRKRGSLDAAYTLTDYAADLVVRNRAAWHDAREYIRRVIESQKILRKTPVEESSP